MRAGNAVRPCIDGVPAFRRIGEAIEKARHSLSLTVAFCHSEMNASIWDAALARGLRVTLLAEHLGQDTAHLDIRTALQLYRQIARDNRCRRDAGDSGWRGLAYRLDPAA